jgi:hypothetical protein
MFKTKIVAAFVSLLISQIAFADLSNKSNKGHECCTNSDKEWSLGVSLQKDNIKKLEKTINSEDVFSTGAVASYYFMNNDNYKGCLYYANAQFKGAFVRQYAHRMESDLANMPLWSILEDTMSIYIDKGKTAADLANFKKDCSKGIKDSFSKIKKWNAKEYNNNVKSSIVMLEKIKLDQKAVNEEIKMFVDKDISTEIEKKLISQLEDKAPAKPTQNKSLGDIAKDVLKEM